MNATRATFQQRAESVVRDFIRSVLLIDDDWPDVREDPAMGETGPAPAEVFVDPSASSVSGPTFTSTPTAADAAIIGAPARGDAKRLLRIQKSVMDAGVLFSGIKYPGAGPEQVRKLAARADVLIVDWHLRAGSDDGSDALGLLKQLHDDGGLHFVCMYTGLGVAAVVKSEIVKKLGTKAEGGEYDFRVANLIVAIRQKPSMNQGPVVDEEEIYDTAVKSIVETYRGYVQIGLLEITNRHREQLPRMLAHLGPDIDAAVVYEATDSASPVRDASGPFLSMLLDEWRALLASSMALSPMKIMSDDGVRAYLQANVGKSNASIAESVEAFVGGALGISVEPQLQLWIKKSMADDLNTWVITGADGLPANVPPAWKKKDEKATRWALLAAVLTGSAPTERKVIYEPLLKVDSLFQQQHDLPSQLTQGTVLRTDTGEYLVCVTPLCDAAHPNKINSVYSFLVGERVDIGTTKADGYGCTVRDEAEHAALNVRVKGYVTLRIVEPSLVPKRVVFGSVWFPARPTAPVGELGEAEADLPPHDISSMLMRFNSGPPVRLTPVAQLRVEFALALAQMAAADATRVGVDRSEFLRTRFSR